MTTRNANFYAKLKRAGLDAEQYAGLVMVGCALEVGQNITIGGAYAVGTPVDTGNARGSWVLTLGRPAGLDAGLGRNPLAEAAATLAKYQLGQQIWWSSRVPYMRRLEYGWSKQAPAGFIRMTMAAWGLIVSKVVKAIKKGAR